ncbi:MAG: DUF1576 domain-containing protein [Lachnospiraceae bacterium]|nr:DUF1576 domain-containing protein [Lachnospiraceae bacterium]
MTDLRHDINMIIRRVCILFTVSLLLAAWAAANYTGETAGEVWKHFTTLLTSPSPLVTDYFRLGSLAAALLNAGLCGLCCTLLTFLPGAEHRPSVWAGFFLVIAHCFYGLDLLNMWPPILGFLVYCKFHRLRFRDNLDWAMFITSFSPFFSEILFRYPMPYDLDFRILGIDIHPFSILLCMVVAIFVACTLPAMMPGAAKLHQGYNLYNGGLATGLLGLFLYAFLFKTMGVTPQGPLEVSNPVYEAHGESYLTFATCFYLILSLICVIYGWYLNGKTFHGYGALLKDSGHKANFLHDYGAGPVWINLGLYMLMMLAYFDIVILVTDGAGFTGATFGIILASMTFAAGGQHPRNVWPILLGYAALSGLVWLLCLVGGREVPWTLSTQGYMNGLAFATGLCPFTGKFGWKIGVLAGFMSAVMCTTTSAMHGGFVLYNGGLTAGITALLLLPMLETYKLHSEKWGRGRH